MSGRLEGLQALRGAACLLVVICHLGHWDARFTGGTAIFAPFHRVGAYGVAVFFALSGFILTYTSADLFGRARAVPGFLGRRLWRAFPPYWAATLLFAPVGCWLFGWDLFTAERAGDWAAWLAMLPWDPANPMVIPYWTMSYEVMFYLAFAAALAAPPRWAAVVLGGWAAGVVGCVATGWPGGAWAKYPLSPYVLEFLGGSAAAWAARRGVGPPARAAAGLGLAYWGAVEGLRAALGDPLGDTPLSRVIAWGVPAVATVYAVALAEGQLRVPRRLADLGDSSYSLYLTHFSVMTFAVVPGMWFPHTRVNHLAWLAGTLAACLAGGVLFHRWVERPLLGLVKTRRKRDPVTVAEPPLPARRAA